MLEFHPDCTRCAFHKTCEHPGIGGRKVRGASIFKRDAVCVVGMAPGWQEDKANRVFEGKSGRLLEGSGKGRGYLGQLPDDVDVWATNAVRCQPPKGVDPKVTQIKACSEWLYDDICALIEKYERVFLLVLGAVAARSVLKSSLKDAFNKQGQTIAKLARHKPVFPVPLPVFATYHPAYLLRENKRTLNAVVVDHMKLLAGALTPSEDGSKAEPLSPVRVGFRDLGRLRPSWDRGRLFFDIETYGIWEGGTAQTVFNPRASAAVDGVPVGKQILTIAVGSKVEGRIHYARARWDDRVRKLTRELLESAASLCGTNLLFDLGYLGADLAWEPAPDQLIEDLCVLSFMQNPDRPEGSLGALGKLLLPDGLEERYGAKGRKHSDWEELLTYNVGDVVNPIGLFDVLEERIAQQGRPENPAVTTRAYSDSMKVMLHMGKHGLRIHPGRLFRRQSKCEAREKRLIEGALKRWEFPLQGKGSGLAKSALFREIVERRPQGIAGGWDLTKKKREVSTAEGNINRATMDEGVPFELRRKAWAIRHHRDNQKLLTTYLRGLSALTERTDRVYAQWFPVPSRFESNDTSYVISGGTRQVRVSCKRPALMTSPKQVKGLFASRYRGGFLLSADYKQLEMRMAALVSGDPVLMGVFEEDRDVHQETLDWVEGRPVGRGEPNYGRMRRNAKFTNFGTLFGGGIGALQEALWKKAKHWLEWDEGGRFIRGFNRLYKVYVGWREQEARRVGEEGATVLPVSGHWLSFTPPGRDELDKAIYNFPIQGPSAEVCKVAHLEVLRMMEGDRLGCVPLTVHDSLVIDSRAPVSLFDEVTARVRPLMEEHWFIRALWDHYGRRVEFPVEFEVLSGYGEDEVQHVEGGQVGRAGGKVEGAAAGGVVVLPDGRVSGDLPAEVGGWSPD